MSGEARSRAFLNLPGAQEDLAEAVAKTGTLVVLVIMAGRPLTFSNIIPKCKAILYAWHPGTMGGPALIDIIFGKSIPSGKLPVSFPRTVSQIPVYYNHKNTGRPPSKEILGIPLGIPQDRKAFVSHYLDSDFTPQFAFGFGLSYTTFSYSGLKISATKLTFQDTLEISVDLENTGKYIATEVVQLYIRDHSASITRPVKELKGFHRISLSPQESRKIMFKINCKDLAFWNKDLKYTSEPGWFDVLVGSSSNDKDLQTARFKLIGN